jgi:hypothetical protein
MASSRSKGPVGLLLPVLGPLFLGLEVRATTPVWLLRIQATPPGSWDRVLGAASNHQSLQEVYVSSTSSPPAQSFFNVRFTRHPRTGSLGNPVDRRMNLKGRPAS